MKIFVTIICFTLVAYGIAKPAYNYQEPKQTFINSAPASSSGAVAVQQSQPLTAFNNQAQTQFISAQPPQYAQTQFVANAPQYTASVAAPAPVQQFVNTAPQYAAPVQQNVVSSAPYQQQPQQQTIVNKEIFIHSAPEETEVIGDQKDADLGPARKNYRIVFIKAPAQNIKLNVESLKRAQAANEEKTVIYVLAKKPDLANIQSQLVSVPLEQKTQKPEVYFIKYKTQEEANRAQQEIQAQYDALGGSTHVSDEGIAPITSVIGGSSGNIGPVAPSFVSSDSLAGAGSVNVASLASNFASSGSVSGSANFVQSAASSEQTSGSYKVSFPVQTPGDKYLPIIKKK